MDQLCVPQGDFSAEPSHWLIEAIAEELAADATDDPRLILARIAERLEPTGLDLYLPLMFPDAD